MVSLQDLLASIRTWQTFSQRLPATGDHARRSSMHTPGTPRCVLHCTDGRRIGRVNQNQFDTGIASDRCTSERAALSAERRTSQKGRVPPIAALRGLKLRMRIA